MTNSRGEIRSAENPAEDLALVPTSLKGPTIVGLSAIAMFVLGFGYWAATAPIMSAAIAVGKVQASGQNQIVEHYEGGIIESILVEEGDRVNAADVLVTLDDTKANSERNRILNSLITAEAALLRALAERDDLNDVNFSTDLLERATRYGLTDNLAQQLGEFKSRKKRYVAELSILDQRIIATREEIEGLEAQKAAEESKLAIIREELENKVELLKLGLTEVTHVAALRRNEADSLGTIGALVAAIGQRKTKITETKEQRFALSAERGETASMKINQLRAEITDLQEQLENRQDILDRASIVSPVNGIVVKFGANTIGGVVKPGDAIAEILPTSSGLVVEAKIHPRDIDTVRIGQDARLRLIALNTRTTPIIGAKVSYVSADRIVDDDTNESYYVARLKMNAELPSDVERDKIFPGMPVEVYISTGSRTFVDYLTRPFLDSFAKAFREE